MDELQYLQNHIQTVGIIAQERQLLFDLQNKLHCDELFWAQRVHQFWLVEGDCSTKYFHAIVKRRRINNKITKIQDLNGNWLENYSEIEKCATNYFQHVYTPRDSATRHQVAEQLANVQIPYLSESHVHSLSSPFTIAEIEFVEFQIHPDRSPSPDGLPALFYQYYWNTVKHDVINMVLSFLHRGYLLKSFNDTYITLIPKINAPTFKDFRPIGLCNVVYKIISKILVNRLQPIMQELITPFQNGFLKGRSIQDNIFFCLKAAYFHPQSLEMQN